MNETQPKIGGSPAMRDVLNEAVSDAADHWNSATRAITTSATEGACFVISIAKLFALLMARASRRQKNGFKLTARPSKARSAGGCCLRRSLHSPSSALLPTNRITTISTARGTQVKGDTARCSE